MIINANALHLPIADNTVQCVVTSPPYYGLRSYGIGTENGEIGLEPTPDEYVAKMVQVFREVKRVLKDDGVLWLNLGDSYAGGGGASGHTSETTNFGRKTESYGAVKTGGNTYGVKAKDLLGIPWMVAFALRADGWYLRSDIIWSKPNPMPESVKDRPTKAHEYVFLLSKSQKYYYDAEAIFEVANYDGRKDTQYKGGNKDVSCFEHERWANKIRGFKTKDQLPDNQHHGADILSSRKQDNTGNPTYTGFNDRYRDNHPDGLPARNKRSVWTINTQPFKGAHFAVMPEKLVEPCVLAGSRVGDVILDPFAGSGTVGVVAQKLGRAFIGVELNPEYVKLAEARLIATPVALPMGVIWN